MTTQQIPTTSPAPAEPTLSMKDLVHLRAKHKRTIDPNKPPETLTPEDLAARMLVATAGDILTEHLGADTLAEIDRVSDELKDLRAQRDALVCAVDSAQQITPIAQHLNEALLLACEFPRLYYGEPPLKAKADIDALCTLIANDASHSAPRRLELAQATVELCEALRRQINQHFGARLAIAAALIPALREHIVPDDDRYPPLQTVNASLEHWLTLSEQLLVHLNQAYQSILLGNEIDQAVPLLTIHSDGRADVVMRPDDAEEFMAKGERMAVLSKAASTGINQLEPEHQRLATYLFGPPETYIAMMKNDTPASTAAPKLHRFEWIAIAGLFFLALLSHDLAVISGVAIAFIFWNRTLGKRLWAAGQ